MIFRLLMIFKYFYNKLVLININYELKIIMNSNTKILPFNNDISNIIRNYYGITLLFANTIKNKLSKIYENIPDTTILLFDIFEKKRNGIDIEGIFTSKEKTINYIVNKEIEIYWDGFDRSKVFKDLKKIDTVYELIPIKWINISKPVYIHDDYYIAIPEDIYKEPKIYLTQYNIHNLDDYFEVNIDEIYPLHYSIVDI